MRIRTFKRLTKKLWLWLPVSYEIAKWLKWPRRLWIAVFFDPMSWCSFPRQFCAIRFTMLAKILLQREVRRLLVSLSLPWNILSLYLRLVSVPSVSSISLCIHSSFLGLWSLEFNSGSGALLVLSFLTFWCHSTSHTRWKWWGVQFWNQHFLSSTFFPSDFHLMDQLCKESFLLFRP